VRVTQNKSILTAKRGYNIKRNGLHVKPFMTALIIRKMDMEGFFLIDIKD